jgi:hypothetical protein
MTAPGSEPIALRLNLLPRTFDDAITRSFFVAMLAMACLMPAQNDTWWHLRVGQEMWLRQALMLQDEFSFTVSGGAWPNHEWLSQLGFYATYRAGGLPLLTLLAATCVTAALGLAWRLLPCRSSHRLVIMGLAMAAIVPAWAIRPQIFTLLLLPAVVHLALRKKYWLMPFVFLVWANLHGGVALGVIALLAVAAGRWLAFGTSGLKPLLAATAASFAATCMTPLGISFWLKIPQAVQHSRANHIMEWQAASLADPSYLAFWAVAFVLVATTVAGGRAGRSVTHVTLLSVALVLLPLALRSRRNIPPFLLIALPALAHNLADWLKQRPVAPRTEAPVLNAAFFAACSAVCIAVVSAAWLTSAKRLQWQPLPLAVLDDVQACGDRVFNRYTDGGYLIWFAPRVRVFIDSRHDPYPFSFVQEYIRIEQSGDYHTAFDRFNIRCALLPESSIIAERLRTDGWRTRLHADGWLVLEAS